MHVLGIDIGGSGIKGALVDVDSGELVTERKRVKTPESATPEPMIDSIMEVAEGLEWEGPIGCGFPGVIKKQMVCTAANLDQSWVGVPLAKLLEEKLGRKTWLINDADAAGHAEMAFGEGNAQQGTVMIITVGTGLGTAVFHDGVLIPNTELGHLQLKLQDIKEPVHAEHWASAAARKKHDLKWSEWGVRLNDYLKHIELLMQPATIILGGGVAKKFHKFEEQITLETPVKAAKLLNQAGIIGAAVAAAKQFS